MLIKFKKPDPRAGAVVQMDSSRGKQLIDAGCAVQVKDEEPEVEVKQEVARAQAPQTLETQEAAAKPRAAKKK